MTNNNLKYLVVGAGGTGAAIGRALTKAGADVSFIARGAHLEAMKQHGLHFISDDDEYVLKPIKAYTMQEYKDTPDIIFVCVKGYSLDDTISFIKGIASSNTVVIPILNIYGTGERMQESLPHILVTDGCIYVATHIEKPGYIRLSGDILRVVYGTRDLADNRPVLKQVHDDLVAGGAEAILSEDIRRDALMKYSYISAQNACGIYYDVTAGEIQQSGKYRDCFANLNEEIKILAKAMGITLIEDPVKINLAIIDSLKPDMMTSMQRDFKAGKQTEIDGIIHAVPRMAKKYNVTLPLYEKISNALKSK